MITAKFTPERGGVVRPRSSLRRAAILAGSLLIAVLALTFGPSGGTASAAQTIAQCNNIDNTGGLGLTCEVTVSNNLDLATGVESSTVYIKECHGAANTAPSSCTESTTSYDTLTTSVSQCNYAEEGGGSSVICTVRVVNNITGDASTTGATINQCNGSGAGGGTEPTLNCDPYPATTSSATITQCNGSVNGGGGSLRVTCTVLPSVMSAQLPVAVNQCNNSANGGGSTVTCSASLSNIVLASATTPVPPKNKLYDSNTDGFLLAGINSDGAMFLGVGLLLLIAAGLLTVAVVSREAGTHH